MIVEYKKSKHYTQECLVMRDLFLISIQAGECCTSILLLKLRAKKKINIKQHQPSGKMTDVTLIFLPRFRSIFMLQFWLLLLYRLCGAQLCVRQIIFDLFFFKLRIIGFGSFSVKSIHCQWPQPLHPNMRVTFMKNQNLAPFWRKRIL